MSGVRITGGSWRGRVLRVPATARPSAGRVREAVFSRWQPRLAGARFLDLFAGSGAVGLEAASRGAGAVTWVEGDRRAAAVLEANRRLVGAGGALRQGDALRVTADLGRQDVRFDLVYADPPYAYGDGARLLAALIPLVEEDGEIAYEHRAGEEPEPPPGLLRTETRRYGDSGVSFFRRARVAADEEGGAAARG